MRGKEPQDLRPGALRAHCRGSRRNGRGEVRLEGSARQPAVVFRDAYLNEMGVTTRLFPDEVTKLCNTAPEPNDPPAPDGLDDVDHFARFIRASKAPPRDSQLAATPQATKGSELFDKIGCATCHERSLTTAPAGTKINGGKFTVPEALGEKTFYPFSDFLLHNVGTGDGIVVPMVEHYGRRMYQITWKNFSPGDFQSAQNKIR